VFNLGVIDCGVIVLSSRVFCFTTRHLSSQKRSSSGEKKIVAILQEKVKNIKGWEGCHTHFVIEGVVQDVFSFPVSTRTICFISFILNIVKK